MLLCDRVATGQRVSLPDDGSVRTAVALTPSIVAKVRSSPVRYILGDAVYENSAYASIDQPDCIYAGLRSLRLPHPVMWVEWMEQRRDGRHVGERARAGLLVECDESGRAGTFCSVWTDGLGGPFQAPACFTFDFDREISSGLEPYDVNRDDAQLYAIYDRLFRHAAFRVDDAWDDSLRRGAKQRFRACLSQFFGANLRDFPFLCAFVLLLTQPRVLKSREINQSKLNRARARKGNAPLLDHVELHMRLDASPYRDGRQAPDDRIGARAHWVRGHLVHRDEKVFWRRSHVRGDASRGMLTRKTIHIEGASPILRAAE